MKSIACFAATICVACTTCRAAVTAEELDLIRALENQTSLQEKDRACARLKRVGSAASVPALATLLPDADLSHSARYALESMHATEAGQALIAALRTTTSLTRIGLVDSLAVRREAAAVPALSPLLNDADARLAASAAFALGRIANGPALAALRRSMEHPHPPVQAAVADGLLACAERLGQTPAARDVYQAILEGFADDHVRAAAFRGLVAAAGSDALDLVTTAIASAKGSTAMVAFACVRDLDDPATTEACVSLLPKLDRVGQAALVGALAQRGDKRAASAIAALVKSPYAEVRTAVLDALALIGTATEVTALVEAAASSQGLEKKAARHALSVLPAQACVDPLLALVTKGPPVIQQESARALTQRRDTAAVPRLLTLAGSGSSAALDALATIAGPEHAPDLMTFVLEASDPDRRTRARDALESVLRRLPAPHTDAQLAFLLEPLRTVSNDLRAVLLPLCQPLRTPGIRSCLRTAAHSADPRLHDAAVRALCQTEDMELLTDLLTLARETQDATTRTMAIRGGVRLTGSGHDHRARINALASLLDTADRPQDQWLVLSGLAAIPDQETLELVKPFLDRLPTRTEAAQALLTIADGLYGSNPSAIKREVEKVRALVTTPALRDQAEALLARIDALGGYITVWDVAGPYRTTGKDWQQLFDTPFAPETQEKTEWSPLAPGMGTEQPWIMDLLNALGGEQCVAYARTVIVSNTEQPARLELGSDDGIKVWLNGKLVHAKNTARPITPGSDTADVTLKKGENSLLLKITQNNMGWAFCVRRMRPDGTELSDTRIVRASAE